MEIQLIKTLTPELTDQLVTVWEKAVHTTHHFLSEEEITNIKTYVPEALNGVEKLYVAFDGEQVTGFMGVNEDKLEMLFVYPSGQGVGTQLMQKENIRYVDVNEQNEDAFAFYRHRGFIVFERSELDEQGNPYPILRMKRQ